MTKKEIEQIIEKAVNIGIASCIKELQPENDRISRHKAEKIFGYSIIHSLLNSGELHTSRSGNSKLSTIYLSKAQITQKNNAREIEKNVFHIK